VITTPMSVDGFLAALGQLNGPQLTSVLHAIAARDSQRFADASWWEATVYVEALLTTTQRRRQATGAGQRAALAVRIAADRHESRSLAPEATRVLARSASEAARALTAGEAETGVSSFLLAPWRTVTDRATSLSAATRAAA